MRSIVILFLLVGIILLAIGYIKSNQSCPPPVVEFRYIPRTFEQEQDAPTPLLSIFGKMFKDDSAWTQTQGYADKYGSRQLNEINKDRGNISDQMISQDMREVF
jgi:hypothetical protein